MTTATLFPLTDSGDDLERVVEARRRVAIDEAEQLDRRRRRADAA